MQLAQDKDGTGLVNQRAVLLTEEADPDLVAGEADRILCSLPVATTTWQQRAFPVNTLSDLVDVIGFAQWLSYAFVALVLLLVATTTVMCVQDRIWELAVLHTTGIRHRRARCDSGSNDGP